MSLLNDLAFAKLGERKLVRHRESGLIMHVPLYAASKMTAHGKGCKCEACASMHMKRTRDTRMKAMMPGNVDMGNRTGSPSMGGKKKFAAEVKQVHPPKGNLNKLKPSQLMHEKGQILP